MLNRVRHASINLNPSGDAVLTGHEPEQDLLAAQEPVLALSVFLDCGIKTAAATPTVSSGTRTLRDRFRVVGGRARTTTRLRLDLCVASATA